MGKSDEKAGDNGSLNIPQSPQNRHQDGGRHVERAHRRVYGPDRGHHEGSDDDGNQDQKHREGIEGFHVDPDEPAAVYVLGESPNGQADLGLKEEKDEQNRQEDGDRRPR